MTKLMVERDGLEASGAKVGGLPWGPVGMGWPVCKTCGEAMQFVAQVLLGAVEGFGGRGEWLLMFFCVKGMWTCKEWEAGSGGNAAIVVDGEGRAEMAAPAGRTVLPGEGRVELVEVDVRSRSGVHAGYWEALRKEPRGVGKVGGQPTWIQGDGTPRCGCGAKMTFVVQLEPRGKSGLSFYGESSGYGFACAACLQAGGFLWQSR
jgi:hypothetical protein